MTDHAYLGAVRAAVESAGFAVLELLALADLHEEAGGDGPVAGLRYLAEYNARHQRREQEGISANPYQPQPHGGRWRWMSTTHPDGDKDAFLCGDDWERLKQKPGGGQVSACGRRVYYPTRAAAYEALADVIDTRTLPPE